MMFDRPDFCKYIGPRKALILLFALSLFGLQKTLAQGKNNGDISTGVVAHDKDAIFSSSAYFTFTVNNPTGKDQKGTVSYIVTTEKGQKVADKVQSVKISQNSNENYDFHLPEMKPGFYKINFMVNVSDYDDTTRRAFGIRPGEIRPETGKPADFDQFWQNTKAELAKITPDFKLTREPKKDKDNREVYLIQFQSLDNYTVRGYMTIPKTNNKSRKFSVLLGLPGYQVSVDPMLGLDDDLAIITLDVRGQGNSRDAINTRRDEYISYRVEDRDKYVMRGVIMDCVRCIDFIYSRPNLRHDNILATGGSMGGYLALAVAGVDNRVNLCSAQNPILCDIPGLVGKIDWPMSAFKKYAATQPGLTMDKVLTNLSYYDAKNFAPNINCPSLIGIGLLDPFAPPTNEFATYNLIPGKKHIIVFKNLAHEIDQKYKDYEGRWMRDTFALF